MTLSPESRAADPPAPSGDSRRKVHARVALALLETLQRLDLPEEVLKDENLSVTLPRRLGLSHVVDAQVRRYRDEARRNRRVPEPEVVDLMRLVARRPDAARVYLEVGRELTRDLPRGWRGLVPARMAVRMAGKRGARALARLFGGPVVRAPRGGSELLLVHSGLFHVALGGTACSLVTGALEGAAESTGRVPIRVRMVAAPRSRPHEVGWVLEEHRPELLDDGDEGPAGLANAPERGGTGGASPSGGGPSPEVPSEGREGEALSA